MGRARACCQSGGREGEEEEGKTSDRRRLGAQDTGAERKGKGSGVRRDQGALGLREPPFRADEKATRTCGPLSEERSRRLRFGCPFERHGEGGVLWPLGESSGERTWRRDLRHREPLALFCRLGGDCGQSREIDPLRHAARREKRDQAGGAEFGGLHHHELGGGAFEKRKKEDKGRLGFGEAEAVLDDELDLFAFQGDDTGPPLASRLVEEAESFSHLEPHDVAKIMGLLPAETEALAGGRERNVIEADGTVHGREAMTHTDIVRDGWLARLPPKLQAYALLGRFDRPIGAWLLFLPGLWSLLLAHPKPLEGFSLALRFALGALLMRAAGCVVNDLWDRDLDRKVARTRLRPLASGALSEIEALGFLIFLLIPAAAILLSLPRTAIALGLLSLLLVATYPLAKRVTYWPQVVLGFTFGWGALLGYAAVRDRLDAASLILYAATIFWILGYDTVYAHQDREDDALVGIKSTALLFGRKSRPFLAFCYGVTLILLLVSGWMAGLGAGFYLLMGLPAVLLFRQVVRLDIDDPRLCLALFKANREVGLAVALALLAGLL
jgi:4-hydroxybenzoate polyprenyltransferase